MESIRPGVLPANDISIGAVSGGASTGRSRNVGQSVTFIERGPEETGWCGDQELGHPAPGNVAMDASQNSDLAIPVKAGRHRFYERFWN
jgi:hypothetical protein